MLRGHWIAGIALGLALSQPVGDHANAQEGAPAAEAEATEAEPEPVEPAPPLPDFSGIEQRLDALTSAIEAASSQPEPAKETERAERDLAAQETMARWAMPLFGAAGLANVLTFIGIILLWQTLRATFRAANTARDTLRSYMTAERAWVGIGLIEAHPTANGGVSFPISWTNRGKTPALRCRFAIGQTIIRKAEITTGVNLEPGETRFLRAAQPQAQWSERFVTLMPGSQYRAGHVVADPEGIRGVKSGEELLIILVEAEYRDAFDNDQARHTTFWIEVAPTDGGTFRYSVVGSTAD